MTSLNGTMVPIETVEVGAGGQAAIEFTNIPQTYTDLCLKISSRDDRGGGTVNNLFSISLNNSTSNFSNRQLWGSGSAASSVTDPFGVTNMVAFETGSGATASTFANTEIYIPNYASSNNKSISIDAVSETNGTTAYTVLNAMLWSNSAAITSIKITPDTANFVQYSTATLYGVASYVGETGGYAVGGTVTSDANYWYHTFTTSGMFTPTQNISADYLIVGGGGGGGFDAGGGGGGGGYRYFTSQNLTSNTNYAVTVGAGGAGSTAAANRGASGSSSSFHTTFSSGGGGGGSASSTSGATGGSGGGGRANGGSGGAGNSGSYSPVEGYAGGTSSNPGAGSGGGGSASVGQNATTTTTGGNGGAATSNSITGSAVNYAGGGGGAVNTTLGGGAGADASGAGAGGTNVRTGGGNATENLGGGGGGGGGNGGSGPGGAGGSGIVIVRYPK